MAEGLRQCGISVAYDDNSMQVTGQATDSKIAGGVTIAAQHDHRIGMSFLTLGMVAAEPITVSDAQPSKQVSPALPHGCQN